MQVSTQSCSSQGSNSYLNVVRTKIPTTSKVIVVGLMILALVDAASSGMTRSSGMTSYTFCDRMTAATKVIFYQFGPLLRAGATALNATVDLAAAQDQIETAFCSGEYPEAAAAINLIPQVAMVVGGVAMACFSQFFW